MAITFRGEASKLKKSAASNNRNGFQEVSAPGPRRGTGGFENSPAKKSCSPITQKSKSPLKMNEALVYGAGQTGKRFVDAGAEVGRAFEQKQEPVAVDLGKQDLTSENKSANNKKGKENKHKEVKGIDAGQFAKGVIIPSASEMDLTLAPTTLTKN